MSDIMKLSVCNIILIVCTISLIFSSCVKEKISVGQASRSATVDLNFSALGESSGTEADAPLEDNENFKTLRVLITDESSKVLKNAFEDFSSQGGKDSYSMRIPNLPQNEPLNFYVIGNEASVNIDKDLSSLTPGESFLPAGFLETLMKNNGERAFPKMRNQINETGLPITGKLTTTLPLENNSMNIECTHSVVKVVLNINNIMTESFWINKISLGSFVPDRGFLFPQNEIIVPNDADVSSYDFIAQTDGITVNQGENKSAFVFYMYETESQKNNYTLALTSPTISKLSESRYIFGEGTENVTLKRNTQLNINATVNVHKDVEVTIKYEVKSWTPATIVVPPFN